MLRSQLSILGLYQWSNNIFDKLIVPSEMDKNVVVTEILSQCAELELVYPNFDIMYDLIGSWTHAELPIWERAYKDATIEYNPIWNVDADETETITRELTGATSNTKSGSNSEALSGSNSEELIGSNSDTINGTTTLISEGTSSETTDSETSSTINNVSESINSTKGYNSNTWAESEKTETDATETSSGEQSETKSGSNSKTDTGTNRETRTGENQETRTGQNQETRTGENQETSDGTATESESITTHKLRGGNIGVTMTQQMLNADLDILPRLNPYQFIVDSFKRRFCLLVY